MDCGWGKRARNRLQSKLGLGFGVEVMELEKYVEREIAKHGGH